MKNLHTPGPWTIDNLNPLDGEDDITIEYQGCPICIVRGTNDMSCIDEEETEDINKEVIANARLIASAPELLEALEGLRDFMQNHYGDDPDEVPLMDKAYEAMDKARGL